MRAVGRGKKISLRLHDGLVSMTDNSGIIYLTDWLLSPEIKEIQYKNWSLDSKLL